MPEEVAAKAILCDIEGTTTSIKFVKDILFPYSLNHVKEYLTLNWDKNETQEVIKSLKEQAKLDTSNNIESIVIIPDEEKDRDKVIENIVNNFHIQIKNDLKVGPVKNLQGLIWASGYKGGSVKGHIYDDVPKAFESWKNKGIKLYIYSSGSVYAQKLLYGFSEKGDLLSFIDGHFDTKVGMKQDVKSYENILKEINFQGSDVVFFTDIAQEAYAAQKAGVTAILLERPGNGPLSDFDRQTFKIINTFNDINLVLSE